MSTIKESIEAGKSVDEIVKERSDDDITSYGLSHKDLQKVYDFLADGYHDMMMAGSFGKLHHSFHSRIAKVVNDIVELQSELRKELR